MDAFTLAGGQADLGANSIVQLVEVLHKPVQIAGYAVLTSGDVVQQFTLRPKNVFTK